MSPAWPSHKARYLLRLLQRELGYVVVKDRGKGSHRILEAPGRPRIIWGHHNKKSLGPREVRAILVNQAGLTISEAKEVLGVD